MGVYADTYRPGASVPYVRATHSSFLRAVRAGGTGQLASGPPRTVRTPSAHQPRACLTYRFTDGWHPRWECKVDTAPEVFQAFIDGPDGPGPGSFINKCYKVMPGAILPPSHFKAKCLFHAKEPSAGSMFWVFHDFKPGYAANPNPNPSPSPNPSPNPSSSTNPDPDQARGQVLGVDSDADGGRLRRDARAE